jgi:copper(I)-binding protein
MMSIASRGAAAILIFAQLVSCSGGVATESRIQVNGVVAPAPANVGSAAAATMSVYATIVNGGPADTLSNVETTAAQTAALHSTMDHGGMQMMHAASYFPIPADSTVRLAPGGTHIMLEGLSRQFTSGDTIAIVLVFQRAGRIPVTAKVVAYEHLEQALRP